MTDIEQGDSSPCLRAARRLFQRVVPAGRPTLSGDDLQLLFQQLDPGQCEEVHQQAARALLAELDLDGDGMVSRDGFCQSLRCKPQLRQLLFAALRVESAQGSSQEAVVEDENARLPLAIIDLPAPPSSARQQMNYPIKARCDIPDSSFPSPAAAGTGEEIGGVLAGGPQFSEQPPLPGRQARRRRSSRFMVSPTSDPLPLRQPPLVSDDREIQTLRARVRHLQDTLEQALHQNGLLKKTVTVQQEEQEIVETTLRQLQAQVRGDAHTIHQLREETEHLRAAEEEAMNAAAVDQVSAPVSDNPVQLLAPASAPHRQDTHVLMADQTSLELLRHERQDLLAANERLEATLQRASAQHAVEVARLRLALEVSERHAIEAASQHDMLCQEIRGLQALRIENQALCDSLDELGDAQGRPRAWSIDEKSTVESPAANSVAYDILLAELQSLRHATKDGTFMATALPTAVAACEPANLVGGAGEGEREGHLVAAPPWTRPVLIKLPSTWPCTMLGTALLGQQMPRWGLLPFVDVLPLRSTVVAMLLATLAASLSETIGQGMTTILHWLTAAGQGQAQALSALLGWPL